GFDALQLGPAGETTAGNPSPYDATAFSRATEAIAWAPLARDAEGGALLAPAALGALRAQRTEGDPGRARHDAARAAQRAALAAAHARLRAARTEPGAEGAAARALDARLAAFAEREAFWLEPYALHEALAARHGCDHRSGWPDPLDRALFEAGGAPAAAARIAELRAAHAAEIERYRLGQLLAHEQHARVRARLAAQGLRLLGDLAIGVSDRDAWAWPAAFLPGYRLGAPPSRTNPEGQPWGYRVLAPARHPDASRARAAADFFARRVGKIFAECDGVRVDHPHGLVDPWVYREDDPDPLRAVRHGARLFG